MILFKQFTAKELIFIDSAISDKKQLFSFITETLFKEKYIENKDDFLHDLWERENQISTEIAKNIAMPHVRTDSVKKDFILILISKKGIKYGGFGSTVKIVFCIGSNQKNNIYLNLMAKTARFLSKKKTINSLLHAEVKEDILKIISDFETTEIVIPTNNNKEYYLIGIIINNPKYFNKAEELILESGLQNSTIIDSEYGVKKALFNIPFFKAFSMLMDHSVNSKTTIGFTTDKDLSEKLNNIFKKEDIDLTKEGVGAIFSMKLFNFIGGIDENIDI